MELYSEMKKREINIHMKRKKENKPYFSAKHSCLKKVSILEPKSSGPWGGREGGGEVTLVGAVSHQEGVLTDIRPGVITEQAPERLV